MEKIHEDITVYAADGRLAGPVMPSDLPNVKIDYKGLLNYAKLKNVRVTELSEDEKNRFVTKIGD